MSQQPGSVTTTTGNCTFGLSDFRLIEVRRHYGPQLQFTFTWLLETPDGKQHAQSTPGLRYVKRSGGSYRIVPPTQRKTTFATYYSTVFSTDLLALVEAALEAGGWKDKVGANNKLENLAEYGRELAGELRGDVTKSEIKGKR